MASMRGSPNGLEHIRGVSLEDAREIRGGERGGNRPLHDGGDGSL